MKKNSNLLIDPQSMWLSHKFYGGLAALSTPFGECAIGEPARRKEADIPARGLHYCGSLGD